MCNSIFNNLIAIKNEIDLHPSPIQISVSHLQYNLRAMQASLAQGGSSDIINLNSQLGKVLEGAIGSISSRNVSLLPTQQDQNIKDQLARLSTAIGAVLPKKEKHIEIQPPVESQKNNVPDLFSQEVIDSLNDLLVCIESYKIYKTLKCATNLNCRIEVIKSLVLLVLNNPQLPSDKRESFQAVQGALAKIPLLRAEDVTPLTEIDTLIKAISKCTVNWDNRGQNKSQAEKELINVLNKIKNLINDCLTNDDGGNALITPSVSAVIDDKRAWLTDTIEEQVIKGKNNGKKKQIGELLETITFIESMKEYSGIPSEIQIFVKHVNKICNKIIKSKVKINDIKKINKLPERIENHIRLLKLCPFPEFELDETTENLLSVISKFRESFVFINKFFNECPTTPTEIKIYRRALASQCKQIELLRDAEIDSGTGHQVSALKLLKSNSTDAEAYSEYMQALDEIKKFIHDMYRLSLTNFLPGKKTITAYNEVKGALEQSHLKMMMAFSRCENLAGNGSPLNEENNIAPKTFFSSSSGRLPPINGISLPVANANMEISVTGLNLNSNQEMPQFPIVSMNQGIISSMSTSDAPLIFGNASVEQEIERRKIFEREMQEKIQRSLAEKQKNKKDMEISVTGLNLNSNQKMPQFPIVSMNQEMINSTPMSDAPLIFGNASVEQEMKEKLEREEQEKIQRLQAEEQEKIKHSMSEFIKAKQFDKAAQLLETLPLDVVKLSLIYDFIDLYIAEERLATLNSSIEYTFLYELTKKTPLFFQRLLPDFQLELIEHITEHSQSMNELVEKWNDSLKTRIESFFAKNMNNRESTFECHSLGSTIVLGIEAIEHMKTGRVLTESKLPANAKDQLNQCVKAISENKLDKVKKHLDELRNVPTRDVYLLICYGHLIDKCFDYERDDFVQTIILKVPLAWRSLVMPMPYSDFNPTLNKELMELGEEFEVWLFAVMRLINWSVNEEKKPIQRRFISLLNELSVFKQ